MSKNYIKTNRVMQMRNLMMVMMIFGLMIVVVIPRAQFEYVSQGGENEQHEFQK